MKNFLRLAALQLILFGMLTAISPVTHSSVYAAAPSGDGGGDGGGSIDMGRAIDRDPTATQSGINGGNLPTSSANTATIKTVLGIIFGIIGAFALLNITLSGFKYITASGNEQRISEAKNGITYSIVGLALAISAQALVTFVVNRL